MSRRLMAVLVSSALALGSISTSAWSASAAAQSVPAVKNQSPLPPAGAAGIRQAQGQGIETWVGIAIIAGLFVVGVILLESDDDDDDSSPSTPGT